MHGSDKRDQAVEQLLRRSRAPSSDTGVAPACLDAETMAAWMDGTLSGAVLEAAQMHAADCDRCQAVLATFAQVNTPMPSPAPDSRRWFAWLVPLTAAAAIATWALLPRTMQAPDAAPAGTMARNDETRSAPPPPPEQTVERATASAPPAVPASAPPTATAPSGPPPATTDDAAGAVLESRQERVQAEADSLQERAKATADDRPAAAPSPTLSEAMAPSAAPPPARAAGNTAVLPRASGLVAQPPDPALQWRVLGRNIERSTNGGTTWITTYTGQLALTAVAAPSATVVWAVGRGGMVIRSADGRTFAPVAFPEAVDLAAVRASDANNATITADDGRAFTTTDAGASWRPSLQDF